MTSFRFLKRKEIDEVKWNALIEQSAFSLPYAFTWYLDSVAENWDALIYKDYQVVMPLVWLRKLGVKCVYQPYYCQQLGLFSKVPIQLEVATDFINRATKQFAYASINFNPGIVDLAQMFSMRARMNLLLNLDQPYSSIREHYSATHKRNIAKAVKLFLNFSEHPELKVFHKFYLGNVNPEKENFKAKHVKIFKAITSTLVTNGHAKIYAVTDNENNLMAAALMIFHQRRIIGIINSTSTAGRKLGATHFLFDRLIQKFAEQPYVLDFEGSSIPGVARFYEGFGAQPEIFYNYQHNIAKNVGRWFKQKVD